MDKKCDACEFLANPTPKTQILETEYWSVGVGNNQAYFGRAYMTLKDHKGSLSALSDEEWSDFHAAVKKIEAGYKNAFGAEPINWGCYMNHAFRAEPFNSHVHWHIYPRYSTAPIFKGVSYKDALFGEFYDHTLERIVDDATVEKIAAELRRHINA